MNTLRPNNSKYKVTEKINCVINKKFKIVKKKINTNVQKKNCLIIQLFLALNHRVEKRITANVQKSHDNSKN